jgi:hypothetical protein
MKLAEIRQELTTYSSRIAQLASAMRNEPLEDAKLDERTRKFVARDFKALEEQLDGLRHLLFDLQDSSLPTYRFQIWQGAAMLADLRSPASVKLYAEQRLAQEDYFMYQVKTVFFGRETIKSLENFLNDEAN